MNNSPEQGAQFDYEVLNDQELINRFRDGQEMAMEALISRYKGMVLKIVAPFLRCGVSSSDLEQEGNLGLWEAVKRYDPSKDAAFDTYAYWWIRQRVVRCCQEHSKTVRVPCYVYEEVQVFRDAMDAFFAEHGREMTDAEMMSRWDFTPKELAKFKEGIAMTGSRTEPFSIVVDKQRGTMDKRFDYFIDGRSLDRIFTRMEELFYSKFGARQRKKITAEQEWRIFLDRFGCNKEECEYSLAELGKMYNLSRDGICDIEHKILDYMGTRKELQRLLHEITG